MTWARLDDRYDDHPKVRRAWRRHPRAVGLHAMAITYCARHETDGLLDADWIGTQLPNGREKARVLAVLCEVGLFELVGDDGAYRVHDFLKYNSSREELISRRDKDSARKREGNPNGIHSESPLGIQADSERNPNGLARARARPRPDPSLPKDPPNPPKGGNRNRDLKRWEAEALAWAESIGVTCPERQRTNFLAAVGRAIDAESFRELMSGPEWPMVTVRDMPCS